MKWRKSSVSALHIPPKPIEEKAPTTKPLHHPVARALQHRRHVPRRQVPNGTDVERVALVPIRAVQKHRVHVRVQLQIGASASVSSCALATSRETGDASRHRDAIELRECLGGCWRNDPDRYLVGAFVNLSLIHISEPTRPY